MDDIVPKIVWASLLLQIQGFTPGVPTLHQDNKSLILLETKCISSAGKRSWRIVICFFFIKDLVKRGSVKIKYCPTSEMKADLLTKALQGESFLTFKNLLGQQ